eukprot:1907041-Amphidinium_carterae.2
MHQPLHRSLEEFVRRQTSLNISLRPLQLRFPTTSCQSSLDGLEPCGSFKTECTHVDHWGGIPLPVVAAKAAPTSTASSHDPQ